MAKARELSPWGTPARRRYLLAAGLVVVAVLFTWLAVAFKSDLNQSEASTGNVALVDVAKTSQVKQDVDSAVETLFSYSYNDTAKTENAAKDLLITDEVRGKYQSLFEQVKQFAPAQKLVVTVKVTRSAVVKLDGDRARVLLFVDQTSLRTATGDQAVVSGAQLGINAELRDGKWKIAGLDDYDNGQSTGLPAPSGSPSASSPASSPSAGLPAPPPQPSSGAPIPGAPSAPTN